MRARFLSADAAAALIPDGATVALMGGGGGLMEATELFQAVERRFLATAVMATAPKYFAGSAR